MGAKLACCCLCSLWMLLLSACDPSSTPADITLRDVRLRQSVQDEFAGEDRVYSPTRSSDALLVADVTVTVTNDTDGPMTAHIPNTAFAVRNDQGKTMTGEGILDAEGHGCVNCSTYDFRQEVGAGETVSADYTLVFLFPEELAHDPLWLQYGESEPIAFTLGKAFTADTPPAIDVPFCEEQLESGAITGENYLCIQDEGALAVTEGQNWVIQSPENEFATGCDYHTDGLCLSAGEWAFGYIPGHLPDPGGSVSMAVIEPTPTSVPAGARIVEFAGHTDASYVAVWHGTQCLGDGRYEIREIEFDPLTNAIVRFAAYFELSCGYDSLGNSMGMYRGAVRWALDEGGPVEYQGSALPW